MRLSVLPSQPGGAWGLSRFSRSENGTVPFRTADSAAPILVSYNSPVPEATWQPTYRHSQPVAQLGHFPDSRVAKMELPPSRTLERVAQRPPRFGQTLRAGKYKLWTDYEHYYTWSNMRDLMLGVAAGSLLANTSMDQDFQDWYQDDVRSAGTDDFSSFWRTFGDGYIFIPAFAALAAAGSACDGHPLGDATGDFSARTTRAYLVGAPPMVFMQYCLGGSRPGETEFESRWRPFEDSNAVSGHAFIGAVPFITAAKMTDRPLLKGGFYLCSTFPAWSRVNDDKHYLSQICLGWWMAYLACNVVNRTECEDRRLTLTPVTTPEMVGMGVIYRR